MGRVFDPCEGREKLRWQCIGMQIEIFSMFMHLIDASNMQLLRAFVNAATLSLAVAAVMKYWAAARKAFCWSCNAVVSSALKLPLL